MATLKPVVIKNGEFQQLQAGDDLIANGLEAFASGGVNIGGTTDPGAGNIGLNNIPTAAALHSGFRGLLIGNSNFIADQGVAANTSLHLSQNALLDVSGVFVRVSADVATSYVQTAGLHLWRVTASGTAGSAITWTEVMRTTPTGGVNIGGTADPGAGSLRITSPSGGNSIPLQLSKAQATNDAGLGIQFQGGVGGTTDRGYIGFTHTGTGSDTLFVPELVNHLGIRYETGLQFGHGNVARVFFGDGVNIGGTTDPGSGNLSATGFLSVSGPITTNIAATTRLSQETAGLAILGAWGVNNTTPGQIGFYVANANGSGGVYAMRIGGTGGVNIGGTTDPGAGRLQITTANEGAIPTPGTPAGQLRMLHSTGQYGLISSVLNTGAVYLQAQRMDGGGATYPILLNPSGGGVNIGDTSDPGAGRLSVGTGGAGTNVGVVTINGGGGLGGGGQVNLATAGTVQIAFGSERTVAGGTGNSQKCVLYAAASLYRLYGMGSGTLSTDTSGNIINSSDETLKAIEGNFERGMADLRGLKFRKGHWTEASGYDTSEEYVWMIAQDLLPRIPEAVFLGLDDKYTVDQGPVLHTVINALNEIDARLARLEGVDAPKPDNTDRKKLAADRIDGLKRRQIERKKNHRIIESYDTKQRQETGQQQEARNGK